jgi:hypothetical protein
VVVKQMLGDIRAVSHYRRRGAECQRVHSFGDEDFEDPLYYTLERLE